MPRSSKNILLVEDTISMAMLYEQQLRAAGYNVHAVENLANAETALNDQRFDLMLLDLNLPDGKGLPFLESLQGTDKEIPAVVITADASLNNAVHAMKLGALDYLVKPFTESRLLITVNNTLECVSLREQVDLLRHNHQERSFHNFIGTSVAMQKVYRMVENVASSKATVFITGASGTGKELCAESIHQAGPRAGKPFIPLNCAAIPHDLLESELFGHVKGSFTGAVDNRDGAARAAEGGTLFLDEMCELDLNLQKKLLRFLQTSTVHPVGAAKPIKVDVRVICATNRNPLEEVRAGRFREDLYFRLNVVPIALPPLKARGDDVIELAKHFLSQYSEEEGKSLSEFSEDALSHMTAYTWPGNVRELQNTIRNIAVLHDGKTVTADMFPPLGGDEYTGSSENAFTNPAISGNAISTSPGSMKSGSTGDTSGGAATYTDKTLAALEREIIEDRIAAFDGSLPKAAQSLGVSPSTLYRKKENWD